MRGNGHALALVALVFAASGCTSGSSSPSTAPSPTATRETSPPVPASHRPALRAHERWIAFQTITSARSGAQAVHLVLQDGRGDFFALDMIPGGEQQHPDWSPDGTRLAVDVLDANGTPDIWIVNVTDWSSTKLVDCGAPCLWVQEPAWSHDGRRIAYQRHITYAGGETSTVEVLDLVSGTTSIVYSTGTDKGVFAPRWS